MVGSAVWRALENHGVGELVGWSSEELDLNDRDAAVAAVHEARPDAVVVAAARVGGIGANSADPVGFFQDNVRIQTNVMEAAHLAGVDRLLFLGSSCIYPRLAPQPLRPDALMTGPLESTNDGYAIAKLAGLVHVQGHRRQHHRRWITALPTNLYGPGDDFDLKSAHVLPALIHRFEQARRDGAHEVTLWGTGTPRREFLHVDDLARACVRLLEHYDAEEPINVGTGEDLTVAELASMVAEIVGFKGAVRWDATRPDGTLRKLLDVGPIVELGWRPEISLFEGITSTHRAFVSTRLAEG
jgi:GDP-L-fucose synthase